jgi:hypothetical protein
MSGGKRGSTYVVELSDALEIPYVRMLIVAGGSQQVRMNRMPNDALAPSVSFHPHCRNKLVAIDKQAAQSRIRGAKLITTRCWELLLTVPDAFLFVARSRGAARLLGDVPHEQAAIGSNAGEDILVSSAEAKVSNALGVAAQERTLGAENVDNSDHVA